MTKRASGTLPAGIQLDRRLPRPLEQQLYDALRSAILAGRLSAGARLPSTRNIARELEVSRNTVLAAFDRLLAEGYVVTRVGSGTRISSALPDDLLRASRSTRVPAGSGRSRLRRVALSAHASSLLEMPADVLPTGGRRRPFRFGSPDVTAFPLRAWSRLEQAEWRRATARDLEYAPPEGLPELRRAIAAYTGLARGTRCSAGQVIVLSSAQQALDLTVRLLLDAGDEAWLEDPGYRGARAALMAAGATIVPVAVDADGLDVAAAVRGAPRARLAYVTPANQFPTGATMSLARRLALLDWARTGSHWIVEDDYDSEFRYDSRPLACLQGMDDLGRVIYVGTFSKSLCPGLRLAFVIVPDDLVDAFRVLRQWSDGHPPTISQRVLVRFLEDGHYERHLRAMRVVYAERQQALLAAADRMLAEHIELAPVAGGLHCVGTLRDRSLEASRVAGMAARQGVELLPLSVFCLRRPSRERLLFGFAPFAPRETVVAIRRLAAALR